ncbi:serine protease [Azospira restricta]
MSQPLQCIAVAVACAGLLGQAHGMTPAELFEKVSPSVMVVRGLSENESPIRQGSGVITGSKTVITNCHVIARAKMVQVRQGGISYQAQLEHADIERDLCQLSVPDLKAPLASVAVPSQDAKVGLRIFTIGAPSGRELTMSDGLLYGLQSAGDKGGPQIEISTPIPPGVSGGGVFDERGKLLGIASALTAKIHVRGNGLVSPAIWIAEVPQRAKQQKANAEEIQSHQKSIAPPSTPVARKMGAEELRLQIANAGPFTVGEKGRPVQFDSNGWWSIDANVNGLPRRGYSSVTADGWLCLTQTFPHTGEQFSGCYDAEHTATGPVALTERKAKP